MISNMAMAGLDVSLSSSKSEESERVHKANAWMEDAVQEFTDEELTWWNATLDEATSTEVDEIVKLYEQTMLDVGVKVECDYDSLNPIIMQYICKYWKGSYGQQKPDHLLLAAYRAGLHLAKSSAVKLFSNALKFIGCASYQEEHPNKSGELVLVLIKQMEMLLSVAGWCLASGVVSEEKYASIVEKLFSDQHNRVVDLVYCISDVAVTCTVEEDLTETDINVFLRCNNLCEVIYIEMSYVSARAEAELRLSTTTTTIEDEKKYEEEDEGEEIFGTRNGDNEEKAFSTEVDTFALVKFLYAYYSSEEMKGKNAEDREDNGLGVFDLAVAGRVKGETYYLTAYKVIEHLNNGFDKQHRYLGIVHDRGYPESRDLSSRPIERNDIRSPSMDEISRLGLGRLLLVTKGGHEVSIFHGVVGLVWKWIISIGVSVGFIGKWICRAMLASTGLPPSTKKNKMVRKLGRSSAPLVFFFLMMLLAPPKHRVYTHAKSNEHFIRHERKVNSAAVLQEISHSDSRSLTNTSTSFLAAANDPNCRQPLIFDWNEDNPYIYERQKEGKKPFTLAQGCEETQRCLFMPDDSIFNVITGGDAVFPVFRNLLSERSPSIEQVLANAKILYDDKSMMNIQGIGTYKGPTGIGEYRVVPQFLADGEALEVTKLVASPSSFSTEVELVRQEKWYHLDQKQTVKWNLRYSYYPCSAVHKREDLEFPPETAQAFSDSGKVDGKIESVCKVVMEHCTEAFQQYNTTEECISYLGSLPHHDPTCQDAFGEYSAMGESFMCKYLHHFMIPLSPDTHCAHAGKGLPDITGKYKCVATDCQKDKANQITGLMKPSSSCSEEDLEELAQGIIYTLQFCLPSLEMQVCMSNCTQAINTYLGRFAEKGVIDSCDSAEVLGSSRLLSLLSVDAHVLLHLCSRDSLLAVDTSSSHLFDGLSIPTCLGVNEYLGSGLKCLGWDWEEISQGMYNEWSSKYKNQRVTQSDDIATAECHVFTLLYTQYLNIQYNQILDDAADMKQTDIQIHPNGHPLALSHEQVSMAFDQTQLRGGMVGATFGHCMIPGEIPDWMQYKPLKAFSQDTNSTAHKLAREFVYSIMKGLTTKPTALPVREDLFDERGLLDYEEMILNLAEENFRALLGDWSSNSDSFWTGHVIDDVRDLTKVSLSFYFPESWHRAQGYLTAVAFNSRRQSLGRKLRDEFTPLQEVVQAFMPLFNVSSSDDYLAYDYMVDTLASTSVFIVKLVWDIVKSVRQDPWNFIEGEGPSSHARFCPGRSYAVQFVIAHAERYFPNDITCVNNMKVHNSVELFNDNVDIADGSKLQVLKTSTSTRSNTLFLFLHGFPDVPQEFAPIISHLQTKLDADYWALNGWSTNKCKITEYAEKVASLITDSKARFQYDKVFLVGHDHGGMVGWVVAGMLSKDVLSGFISFSPSPQILSKSLSMFPARKIPFYNLMRPLAGSTYLATKDFRLLDDALTNETFWPEYRDEYHQMWEEVGAHDLTCVYRENFDVVGGSITLRDLDISEEDIEIETDVLLISGEVDIFYPRKLYHASIGAMKPQRGQQLSHTEIYNASHHNILHDHSKETSHHIEMFARSVNRKRLSLWSRVTIPPQVHSSYDEEVSSDAITFYVYVLTFVVMLTGIIMELTIGPMLVGKLGFSVYLFAQIMAATINFGCFFAANLITLPIYTVGLFKLGYPEVTAHIIGPIRSPEFYFDSKPFRVMSFISGIAYVVHHAGGTILYMVVSLHEMNPLSLGNLALAVGFQHLVVFIKYRYKHLYSFLLIGLEIWFQLESYYALTFATTSARVGIGMLLMSHYIWFVHGIMKTSLEIFKINESCNGKMDDEEDPDLSETDDSKSVVSSVRSSKSSAAYKQHSLRLFSSIHSNGDGDENYSGTGNYDTSTLADTIEERAPASTPSMHKHGSLRLYQSSIHSINEEGDRRSESEGGKNEQPATNGSEPTPSPSPRVRFQNKNTNGAVAVSRRSMSQSRSSMLVSRKSRLFDSDEVMHLMGFDN